MWEYIKIVVFGLFFWAFVWMCSALLYTSDYFYL